MLIDWADCILVADQKEIIHRLPLKALPKIDLRFNIGEDEWGDPNNIELWNIIQHQLDGFKDYPMIKRDRTY